MAEKGVWWSMQPMANDEDALKFENPISTAKYEMNPVFQVLNQPLR